MRIWRPQLLYNPDWTHSFFSVTVLGSWSYGIKADAWQSTARGNRYLPLLILSALQQVNMNTDSYKSFVSDDSREARRQSTDWCCARVPAFHFADEMKRQTEFASCFCVGVVHPQSLGIKARFLIV